MIAIKKNNISLNALSATALTLPGLFSPFIHAADSDELDFQYSHYQEGKRSIAITDPNNGTNVIGTKSLNPIEVESLHGSAKISLTDRVKFAFNYLQDTWGGATPLATTPFLATGNQGYGKDPNAPIKTIVGASPYATSGAYLSSLKIDSKLNRLFATDQLDPISGLPIYKNDNRLTHVMATASPETRKQGDFKLSYDWDNVALSAGGGISIEDDYDSRFGNIGGRFDFNQKHTTLNVDLSYTNSDTHATLDHDDYTKHNLLPKSQFSINSKTGPLIQGTRQDWSTHLGLTQILNKNALISADFSYTRSNGYLSNPYKGVAIAFADIHYDKLQSPVILPDGVFPADIAIFTEQRPELRNQYNVGGRYVQFIEALDAALHFDYRFSADDWGIHAHTFEGDWVQSLGDGWTVTPRVRYYSQEAASFYAPYLITEQPAVQFFKNDDGYYIRIGSDGREYSWRNDPNGIPIFDANGIPINFDAQGNPAPSSVTVSEASLKTQSFDPKKLPTHYSSDQRLSGFGTVSGGVTVSKQFAKGVAMDLGFEYYTHQGGLKIGGGGESNYADYDYWVANANLKVNLEALALRTGSGGSGTQHHNEHGHHHSSHEPAGVMFGHMLPKAGDFMTGYRFMWSSQSSNMLKGSNVVNDATIIANGCVGDTCYLAPNNMTMSMHMLDLMYAPTDWLTLMLMPQFVDMHMSMRPLEGMEAPTIAGNAGPHFTHHSQNPHETGGIGDLGMYALVKLFDNGSHHLHTTIGFSAPTGDVDIQLRRAHQVDGGFQDYGMQLGSGTWDFKPSVTYTGHIDDWSWGAQANGTIRMEDHNKSGYRLGDIFQGTLWGGYNVTHWLTASVRGVYTLQGSINGQFIGSSGGQFKDKNRVCSTETQPKLDANGNGLIDDQGNPINISVPVYCYSSILKFGSQDYPQNYGGHFWDVGFGLNAQVPSGPLAGNRVSLEWLQPVHTDYHGYQLDRDGTFSATWSIMF